jgi:hypothetical protein
MKGAEDIRMILKGGWEANVIPPMKNVILPRVPIFEGMTLLEWKIDKYSSLLIR